MRLLRIFRGRGLECAQFVEMVTDYLEGAMAADDRKRLEKHLRRCGGCARYLRQIRRTIEVSGRLTVADVEALDSHGREDLMAAFREFHAGAG